jgi:hypothetical protein
MLVFLAEMPAARFVALESVQSEQLPEFEEVRDATCTFEGRIQILGGTRDVHILPELAYSNQLASTQDRSLSRSILPDCQTATREQTQEDDRMTAIRKSVILELLVAQSRTETENDR